jgi:hypothetical protein
MPVQDATTFWRECVVAVLDVFPGLPLVGYETGEALAQAEALGFEVIQPLRIWQTVTQPS